MSQHLHIEYKKIERLLVFYQKRHSIIYVRLIRNVQQLGNGRLFGEMLYGMTDFLTFKSDIFNA